MDRDTTMAGLGLVFIFFILAGVFLLTKPLPPTSVSASFSCPTLTVAVTSEGEALEGATVFVILDDQVVSSGSTAADGTFNTRLSNDGTYVVVAEKEGYAKSSTALFADGETCTSTNGANDPPTPRESDGSSDEGQASGDALSATLIMASLLFIVFLFYVFLFMLSKVVSSPFLEQTAKAGLLDTLLVSVVVITMVPLILNGDLLQFATKFVSAFLPEGATPCPVNSNGACYAEGWYEATVAPLNEGLKKLVAKIDDQLVFASVNSGVISMSFQGSGLGFSQWLKTDDDYAGAGAWAGSLSPSTRLGFGGEYAFFRNLLFSFRSHVVSLITLMSFISTLKSVALNTDLLLQVFFLGALLRAFNFSKGAGAFLMAFALALNVVFVPALIWGFSISSSLDSGVSLATFEEATSNLEFQSEPEGFFARTVEFFKDTLAVVDAPSPLQGERAAHIADKIFSADISTLMFAIVLYTLVLSFSLLLVVSASGGLSKLLGADVSIWIIGQLAEMV